MNEFLIVFLFTSFANAFHKLTVVSDFEIAESLYLRIRQNSELYFFTLVALAVSFNAVLISQTLHHYNCTCIQT